MLRSSSLQSILLQLEQVVFDQMFLHLVQINLMKDIQKIVKKKNRFSTGKSFIFYYYYFDLAGTIVINVNTLGSTGLLIGDHLFPLLLLLISVNMVYLS